MNREAKIADLEKYLGVTLTQPDLRFVLVKQVESYHSLLHLSLLTGLLIG